MPDDFIQEENVAEPSAAMGETADTLVRDLIETETHIANRSLQLMRLRYQKEKENWEKTFNVQEREILGLREKLKETEAQLQRLRDDYAQLRLEETEKVKVSSREMQEKQKTEKEKWLIIEEQIKTYRDIADGIQNRLIEEQKKFAELREKSAGQEQDFREKFQKLENELFSAREQILRKDELLSREKALYSSEISSLKEQMARIQKVYDDEKASRESDLGKKQDELKKLQETVQDATISLIENRHKTELLQKEIADKETGIRELEGENRKLLLQIEQEHKKWQEAFRFEQEKWQKDIDGFVKREIIIKDSTSEQVKRVMGMIGSLESQLKAEKEIRSKLEVEVEGLRNDKSAFELRKQEIINEYEKTGENQKTENIKLINELAQLKAALSEQETLYQLEKAKKQELQLKSNHLDKDKEKFIIQLQQERDTWKATLSEEQKKYSDQVAELTERYESLKAARDREITSLTQQVNSLNGEYNELRLIYQSVKGESEDAKRNVQELEKERAELEAILGNEQSKLEAAKNELEQKNRESLKSLGEAEARLAQSQEYLRTKENELNDRQSRINELENEILKLENNRDNLLKDNNRLRDDYELKIGKYVQAISENDARMIQLQGQLRVKENELNEKTLLLKDIELEKTNLAANFEKERENLLREIASQAMNFEKRKNELVMRQEAVTKQFENEILRLDGIASALKAKVLDQTKNIEQKESEIKSLQGKILNLENRLGSETGSNSDKEIEINRLRRDMEQLKIQSAKETHNSEIAEGNILKLKEELAHVKEIETKLRNDWRAEIESCNERYNALYEAFLKEREQKEIFSSENKLYSSRISEIEQIQSGLLKEIDLLETSRDVQIKEFNEKVTGLQEKFNSVMFQYRKEKEELQKEIEHQAGTKQQHKMIIDDLQNRISMVEQEKNLVSTKLSRELELRNGEIILLNNRMEELEKDLKEVTEKYYTEKAEMLNKARDLEGQLALFNAIRDSDKEGSKEVEK